MIILKRIKDYHDKTRKYSIYLDNKKVGTIGNGKELRLDIENGHHTLYLKIDWCTSNILEFDLQTNDLTFECYSSLKGSLKPFSIKNYITKSNYIKLIMT